MKMKHAVWAAVCLIGSAGAVLAQDGEKKGDELKREFERSMKALREKFDQERARLEKEFKMALEKRGEPEEKKKPHGVEDMVQGLLKRVESLEKKLENELPRLRELPRALPRDFDFKGFGDRVPEGWKKWMEQMPRWKGGEDFKFEFRKSEPK